MHDTLYRLFLEGLRVIPGIPRVVVIKVSRRALQNLCNQITPQLRCLLAAVRVYERGLRVHLDTGTHRILQKVSLRSLGIAPTLWAVAVDNCEKRLVGADSERESSWHRV